ncbi:hypothetical protein D3C80_2214850 [compost metagenome]
MPEAVTRKVISAASRSLGSLMAWVRPPMIEANSARAAIDRISALGRAVNSAARVAPKIPAMP